MECQTYSQAVDQRLYQQLPDCKFGTPVDSVNSLMKDADLSIN